MTALAPFRRARVLAAGVLTALAVILVAPAASAHDVLIDSDPREGDTLTRSPQTITLTFNNNPLEVGSAIAVTDADGATVVEGEGTVEGTDVTLALPEGLPSGDYEARWRVASSDGHPIDGVITFAVEVPEPAEPTGETTDETADEAGEPAEVTAAPPVTPGPDPADEPADEPQGSGLSSLPLWLRVAIGLAALAAVVGLIVRVTRRERGERM